MLVGDLINATRELGPDPSQVILPPTITAISGATTGGGLNAGLFFVVATLVNVYGETLPSAESQITLTGSQDTISITLNFQPLGLLYARVYYGRSSGVYLGYMQFDAQSGFTFSVAGPIQSQNNPPTKSSAYLPDSDGGFVTAAGMYRWINEAQKACARVTGGIQDATGIASVSGQRRYVLNGQWLRLDYAFYDGWLLDLGSKANVFYNRNVTANISCSLMVDAQSDTTRAELYWTPGRTSGTTTTSGTTSATATSIPINASSGWLLGDGFLLCESEIISYSAQSASQFTGCVRGWGGTLAVSHPTDSAISELNIMLYGYRMPYVYSVGDSAKTLAVPPGWEPFLKDYMLGLFRAAEQETQEGQSLMKKATDGLMEWVKSNKQIAGPRQSRMYGDSGIRGLVPGGLSGGIVIP